MNRSARRPRFAVVLGCLTGMSGAAFGAAPSDSTASSSVEEVVVSSSRIPSNLSSVPGSVTVVSAAEIAEVAKVTSDIGAILSLTVPGYGVSSNSASNLGMTMRGRKPAVFIDGVPVTTALRDGGRDARLIAPSALDSVQVIRGSTALYGLGGAGGLINYVTRVPGEGPTAYQTSLGMGFSADHPSDSMRYTLQQYIGGRTGDLGYVVSGFYEQQGSFFDADGDRIPPDPQLQGGLADTRSYNVFGKLSYDFDATRRLQGFINAYRMKQDTDYSGGVGVFRHVKTPAVHTKPPGEDQKTENLVMSLTYTDSDVFGSTLSVNGYYADYTAMFSFFPWPQFPDPAARADPALGGGQSEIESSRSGLRLDIRTPVGKSANLLWGVDYQYDDAVQPLTNGRIFVPRLKQDSIAAFVQAEWDINDWLSFNGGLRYEDMRLTVDDFVTIPLYYPISLGGQEVQGGKLKYSKAVKNLGLVFHARDNLDIFAAFSQGFSVADLGRVLRTTTLPTVAGFKPKALVIDNYELGVRGSLSEVHYSFAAFRSTSDLGTSFNGQTLEVVRAPEEIYGFEATLDASLGERARVGATYSRVLGRLDTNGDGNVTHADRHLDSSRLAPDKITAFVDFKINPDWSARLQGLYSRPQSLRGNADGYGNPDVEGFTLIDASVTGKVGPGMLTVGVQNLLNEDYFTPDAWRAATAQQFTKGPGAMVSLQYTVDY